MDRLRRSFRDSFRRRKDPHVPESSKPHQWQADETAVRSATCAFHVKVLRSTIYYYYSKNRSFHFKWTSSIPKSIFNIRHSRLFCFTNGSTDQTRHLLRQTYVRVTWITNLTVRKKLFSGIECTKTRERVYNRKSGSQQP